MARVTGDAHVGLVVVADDGIVVGADGHRRVAADILRSSPHRSRSGPTRLRSGTRRERVGVAIIVGGLLTTLVSAIKTAERQAAQIELELGSLNGQDPPTSRDHDRISKDLRTCLNDWRALLHRHIPQARQILRKLLVERVVFTPKTDHYEFVGTWTLGKLVSGVVNLPQGMASPRGMDTLWNGESRGVVKAA